PMYSSVAVTITTVTGIRKYGIFYFFFFSSRRRHTRSKRDWSSDVCSSDLEHIVVKTKKEKGRMQLDDKIQIIIGWVSIMAAILRSEERRVGKECRSRWSADN